MAKDMYWVDPDKLFADSDQSELDVFHDTLLDATGNSLDNEQLLAEFKKLPDTLQYFAMRWGVHDTDFSTLVISHFDLKKARPDGPQD